MKRIWLHTLLWLAAIAAALLLALAGPERSGEHHPPESLLPHGAAAPR
jgi:hypothetical protein